MQAAQQGHSKAINEVILLYTKRKLNEEYLNVLGSNQEERQNTIEAWLNNINNQDSGKQKPAH